VGTVATLALLTGLFYHVYGFDFLHEAYLYHLTRKDTRYCATLISLCFCSQNLTTTAEAFAYARRHSYDF
jgi:hypothetical protein